jgi:bifunctional UDP-N-acetylglucosamine pyrophosphorylase/glucosamine-1-phosphate N-acetyltransferase
MISMAEIRAIIAAAGKGKRSGLDYPKTLFPVQGKPILGRIIDLVAPYDDCPTIIVSPSGRPAIEAYLASAGYRAHLVEQPSPAGMGDAVLYFEQSPAASAEHALLIWGDIPLISRHTLDATMAWHLNHDADITFPTRLVDSAYTVTKRDAAGRVTAVEETRESGATPRAGEREIGMFIFRKEPILGLLKQDLTRKYGARTGEHGFLYVIEHAAAAGLKVAGLPIAVEQDLISLNALSDLDTIA